MNTVQLDSIKVRKQIMSAFGDLKDGQQGRLLKNLGIGEYNDVELFTINPAYFYEVYEKFLENGCK